MKETLKAIREAKKQLARLAKDLPNLDANCTVYCIAIDAVEYLDQLLKELPPSMKEAKRLAKKNPDLLGKNW